MKKTAIRFNRRSVLLIISFIIVIIPSKIFSTKDINEHASLKEFTAHLDARIPALMQDYEVPGLNIALVKRGETVWLQAYGYADLEEGRKMTVDTPCRVESISKSLTALGVIKLVEQGLIDPDAPVQNYLHDWKLPAPKAIIAVVTALMMLVLYGGLGLVGLTLSRKLGFAGIRDDRVSNRQRFLIPGLVGAALGLFFIGADTVLSRFHSLGNIPHPPFPTSLEASVVAGIGEEIMFRLFFISFWTWLISSVLLKRKWQSQIFWMVTVLSAFAFAAAHLPSVVMLFSLKQFNRIPPALLIEILLINGMLSVAAAYYFRKYGFLAAVGIHFWADVVWHVIWGLF